MKITELNVYPIKGCRGTPLTETFLDEQGFIFDRRWMIVRAEEGRFITQREVPHLARIIPTVTPDKMIVEFDSLMPLLLPTLPDEELKRRTVTVWNFTGEALDCGNEAAGWFSEALGFSCRLVRTPEDFTRRVNPLYARNDDRVGFADGYPILLAARSSLDDLNLRLIEKGAEPVPMSRFRPNIVVAGTVPWEEDQWTTLTVTGTRFVFRVTKPCARCAVTTVDQIAGEKTGVEPLATLSTFRRDDDNKVNFAINLVHNRFVPDAPLRVGDTLEIE